MLVGTWQINVQGPSGNFTGQLRIASLNTGGIIQGTIVLTDISQIITISGSYNDLEQEINFTRSLSEDFAQQYVGTVNFNTNPSTIYGRMAQLFPLDLGIDPALSSRWSAQKEVQEIDTAPSMHKSVSRRNSCSHVLNA
jgi:hypothetical protein